jgi:hypothetical protein
LGKEKRRNPVEEEEEDYGAQRLVYRGSGRKEVATSSTSFWGICS